MKKLIAVIAATLVGASSLFAISNAVEVCFDVPMMVQTNNYSSMGITYESNYFDVGFGFDVADTLKLTNMVGIKADAGFWWPNQTQLSTKITSGGSTTTNGPHTYNYSDTYSQYYLFNLFAGLSISPVSNKKGLSVIVTPGVDFNWGTWSYKDSDTTNNNFHFGAGVDLAVTYSIKKNLYLTAGCPCVWFFSETNNGTTNDNYKGAFSFTPKIGLGYYF